MSIYKDILAKSSVYSASIIFLRVTSFLFMPVFTRLLTPADYGILELLDITLSVFSSLIGVQLGLALFYFYSLSSSEKERDEMTSTAMMGSLLMGAGIILVFGGLSPLMSKIVFRTNIYTTLFYLAFINLGLSVPLETGLSWFRARNQAKQYAIFSVGRYLAGSAASLLFLIVLRQGVASIQWGAMISSVVAALYLGIRICRQTGVRLLWPVFWQQAKYAGPFTFSGVMMLMLHYGDRFFLLRTVSLTDIGIYAIAYKFGMIVSLVQAPFTLYWGSQMFAVTQGPEGDQVYSRVFTYLCFVLSLVVLGVSLFIHPALRLMAAPEFRVAAVYVPWVALAYLFRALGDQARSAFNIEKRTHMHVICNLIGAVVCVSLYAVLIPRYGVWGAVIATLGGFFALMVVSIWLAQRIRHYDLEYRRCFQVAVCSLLCVGMDLWLDPKGVWLQIGAGVLLLGAWWVLLVITGFFDHTERRKAAETLVDLRRRYLSRTASV